LPPHISVSRPVLALNIATPSGGFSETALHQQRGRHSYQVLPADLAPYMRQPVPDAYQRIPQAHQHRKHVQQVLPGPSLTGNNACPVHFRPISKTVLLIVLFTLKR